MTEARRKLAPQTAKALGSCMRSLVTFAHKSRWLPREVDPMWLVSYSTKGEFQGEAAGFVPRDSLPSEEQCSALFDALLALGEPAWGLAMRLKHRSGVRWGELIALRPVDIEFDPHRVVRPDGEPAERRQFLRLWTRVARKAEGPMRSPTVANWASHDLRHVAACWMLFDVGIDAATVSLMLGHANPEDALMHPA